MTASSTSTDRNPNPETCIHLIGRNTALEPRTSRSRAMIVTKRVYDQQQAGGKRFLVERLWPRGIKKEDLAYDAWLKDVAPVRNSGRGSRMIRRSITNSCAGITKSWRNTRKPGNRSSRRRGGARLRSFTAPATPNITTRSRCSTISRPNSGRPARDSRMYGKLRGADRIPPA